MSSDGPTRRLVVQGTSASLLAFLGCRSLGGAAPPSAAPPGSGEPRAMFGFVSISPSREDTVRLPPGYHYDLVSAWGDPVVAGARPFTRGAGAAEQARCAGMGHDGMALYPLPRDAPITDRALMAVNYEYTDDNLLSPDGMLAWSAEKVALSKSAHGVGILEIELRDGRWRPVAGSRYGRRITADTPIAIGGPAAGHGSMRTAADPAGRTVLGTFNNCSYGKTPWGTYLTCEENVTPYFVNDGTDVPRTQRRYGLGSSSESWGFRWHEHDARFNAALHPNEPNRHGWVVEIDPYDPGAVPIKRTALGRIGHEGATVTLGRDGSVVVYMGDDDFRSKFEHIYKFVSARPFQRDAGPGANRDLLETGTLYAARFDADGTGQWLPLVHGANGLDDSRGFAGQAEVLIDARSAADTVGASYMDRPEWIAVHPENGSVFCSLSNNSARGKEPVFGGKEPLGADGANPRAPNTMGHIIRWQEDGGDAAALRFRWDIFLLAGDAQLADPVKRGNVKGGIAFGQPDGLTFDARGRLWIATDASSKHIVTPEWANIGNNQLLAADPRTGEVRRFLTGPVGCELTGAVFTPDMRTLFVNIQHPGEPPIGHPARVDPKKPGEYSGWPGGPGAYPRSATIAIRRDDGGVIGD
jgi:uncharacterized protein